MPESQIPPPVEQPLQTTRDARHTAAPQEGFLFGSAGLRAGWGIALFVLFFAFCMTAEVALLQHLRALPAAGVHVFTPVMTLWNDAPACFSVLLITFLLAKIERRPTATYGFGGERKLQRFLIGLVWGVFTLSLLVLLLAKTGLLHFDGCLLTGFEAMRYGTAWAGCFVLVALFEESLLRGYLQFTLARGLSAIYGALSDTPHRDALGFWTAALLLSFLFGASHHGNAGESPLGLAAAMAAGLVFCFSLWRTGSLWWAIGFHAAWDWAQSFLYGVADSGTVSAGRLFATHPAGKTILSGGLTGPEGSVFVFPVLALIAVVIALTLPQMPRAAA